MKYNISSEQNGKTIKEILKVDLGLSMAFIKHLKFSEGGILLNGEHATVRRTVSEGDILTLMTEDSEAGERLTPTHIPLDIAFEDESLIIPCKPPFMPTHPSHLHHGDTLADALAYRFAHKPFVFRPVNRLDRNTSGLTIVAKNRISAARLAESMQAGKIKKQYVAILHGRLPEDEGKIETYMRRTAESIIVRENCGESEGGDYALTTYKVLCTTDSYSLVLASPRTGRTHQLRVHFAGLGCPIVGDDLYGKATAEPLISRHALHAAKLLFPHPVSGEEMKISAPLHEDMRLLSEELFGSCVPLIDGSDFGLN